MTSHHVCAKSNPRCMRRHLARNTNDGRTPRGGAVWGWGWGCRDIKRHARPHHTHATYGGPTCPAVQPAVDTHWPRPGPARPPARTMKDMRPPPYCRGRAPPSSCEVAESCARYEISLREPSATATHILGSGDPRIWASFYLFIYFEFLFAKKSRKILLLSKGH